MSRAGTRTAALVMQLRWPVLVALALALTAGAAAAPPDSSKPTYRVLVFTRAAAERHASTKAAWRRSASWATRR